MNSKKRILILGGTAIQIPFIRMCIEQGHYVITADNRPNNPGHALANEYHNTSITDPEAVLALAKELQVDAVVNYILEAGIQAAAYAQEKLGLPTSPYQSVHTLSNKILFRQYLRDNGFSTPRVYGLDELEQITFPVVVKPADLWGSRGFTKVTSPEQLQPAIQYAMQNSLHGEIIIEQFIQSHLADIEGDGFAVNGQLTTHVWGDCYPDPEAPNPVTPVCYCYPSVHPQQQLDKLDSELQRLISLLQMQTNAYNIEARITADGTVYLMEVAPRNGSNATTDVTSLSTGCDIMMGTLRAALGDRCQDLTDAPCQGFWASYIVHSNQEGIYQGIHYEADFERKNLVRFDPYVNIGDAIHPYTGTNCTIGMLIARFDSRQELDQFRLRPTDYFKV